MYVDPEKLAVAVVESQAAGTITPGFYTLVVLIAALACRRFGLSDVDDVTQEVVLVVLKMLPRLDPNVNLFSYLTNMVRSIRYARHRKTVRFGEMASRYYRERCGSTP
jgi:DNA-directed RNA polymerase specialized sigma24 family protein